MMVMASISIHPFLTAQVFLLIELMFSVLSEILFIENRLEKQGKATRNSALVISGVSFHSALV